MPEAHWPCCGITVQNYGSAALRENLQVALGTDFKDMFAVRGWIPKRYRCVAIEAFAGVGNHDLTSTQ